jgi:hypothetical protein
MQVIGHDFWFYPMQSTNYFPAINIGRMISHDDELGPTMSIIGEIYFAWSMGYHQLLF